MKFLDYDINSEVNRTAEEEWMPHNALADDFMEWHYVTCPMTGANGHQYFFFISNLNMSSVITRTAIEKASGKVIPKDMLPYTIVSHFSDYNDYIFKSGRDIVIAKEEQVFDRERNSLILHNAQNGFEIDFQYKDDSLNLYCKNKNFTCELHFSGGKRVMWLQDSLQKKGLIRQGAENDRSFYYSLPKLPFHGWVQYTDATGKEIKTDVYGQGWVDRQWGDFTSQSWEWTSFRFADGDRINVYNFAEGHQVGAYQHGNDEPVYFDNFKIIQNGYARSGNNVWFSYDWNYELPVKDHNYHVVPLSPKNTIEGPYNTYYEGLGRLLDNNGVQVGWTVTESMDVRCMNNEPYGKQNYFPSERK